MSHIEPLNRLLADATVFYQQLRNFHWMVNGPYFFALHEKFEELYRKWAEHGDAIAERILTIGGKPVRTLAAAVEKSGLEETDKELDATAMVDKVLGDMEHVERSLHKLLTLGEEAHDRGTVTLLDDIRAGLEKDAWMLRAFQGTGVPY